MSNLTDLYGNSDKKRPKESREKIPGAATDFFDREHKFHDGFKTGRTKGDNPQFTEEGLDHYNTEKDELTPPESFDPSTPLHRYTPDTPFFNPGEGSS
ncbi:hypothetical protein LCGC14_1219360 [marine sediment metagenome]|uniref:Uncharacterized protein n=1 Tax=marine sediment metagenome TaxID=412755 RepID=A0A0F9LZ34_9ZZZZ